MLPGQRPKNNLRALLQEKLTVMRSKGNQGKNQTTQSGPNSSNKQDRNKKLILTQRHQITFRLILKK